MLPDRPRWGCRRSARPSKDFLASKPKIKLQTRYAIRKGDVALLRSQWEITGIDPSGQPVEATQHSSTEVVRRQSGGTWLYVIDHPFGAD
jgi:ketosteroid isomerase-like protein